MKAAGVILAIAVALTLQTTLARFVVRAIVPVDLVLVVVVYVAVTSGPVTGLLTGTAAGLAQDALSSGVIGVGGLAKTVVGFLAGVVGTQFIVTQPVPRFVAFVAATVAHGMLLLGLYVLLDLRQFSSPWAEVGSQAIGNAVVGVVAFQAIEVLPGAWDRWRAHRDRIRR